MGKVLVLFILSLGLVCRLHAQKIQPRTIKFTDAAKRSLAEKEEKEEKEADEGWREERVDMPLPPGANLKWQVLSSQNRIAEPNRQQSPQTAASFNGLDDANSLIPPDVSGAVGMSNTMVTLNDRYRVLDKTGGIISTSNATAFWSPLPTGATGHSDPHVKYDQYANRWYLVAQTSPLNDNYMLLAVSQTNDPSGSWTTYRIKIDVSGTVDSAMDYPLVGFNQNWLVISTNVFNAAGTVNQGTRIYVFDKANLLAGGALNFNANAQVIASDNTQGFSLCPATVFETGAPSTTMYTVQNWNSSFGAIRLVSLTGTLPSVTWNTGSAAFPVSSVVWNAGSPITDFAPQSGDLRKITNNDPRISSAVMVNNKIWCTHSVFMPTGTATRTAIQWWQLQTDGTVLQNAKIDDPTGKIFRAFSSIAVNNNEDVLIGYSIFSDSIYAGAAYSFRSACLPGNGMMDEVIYKGGADRYFKNFGGTRDRWGDYSYACVDPSNQSLWTLQEYSAARVNAPGLNDNDSRWGTWWAKVVPPTTNAISFAKATQIISETSSGSGCPKFTDYSFTLNARCAANGNAMVTLSGGGSAKNGSDYQILTPSLSFVNGDQSKLVTVRVFDDAEVESSETIVLSYSISGTGVIANDDNQTLTITLNDDDAPATAGSNYTSLLGVNSGTSNTTSPLQATSLRGKFQFIVLASELKGKGFKAGNINGLTMFVNSLGSGGSFVYNGFTIAMGHTTSGSYSSSSFLTPTLTTVYSNNYTVSGAGNQTLNFTTPFVWDGSSNVVVQMCFDNTGGTIATANDLLNATTTPLGSGLTCLILSKNSTPGATTAGCSLTTVTATTTTRPDVTFSQSVPASSIASSLNTSYTVSFGPDADVYIYSGTGEALARLRNLSSFDYGCTTVTIDRDNATVGAASKRFWNNDAQNYLASKTYTVTPTNNNPSGDYEITLYYTLAEITGWQTATGQNWASAKIVKVPARIDDITPTSATTGIVVDQVVTPSTFGINYAIKGTFSSGFSGFGVGVPGSSPLPITLLSFDGQKKNEQAQLSWETAFEYNNDHFEVETGRDGMSFASVASIKSLGNAFTEQSYSFVHQTPAKGVNYYRLKQVDIDGKFTYSRIIAISFDSKGRSVVVYPNPASEKLTLKFDGVVQAVSVNLVSANGHLVARQSLGTVNFTKDIFISTLPTGSYFLEIFIGKDKQVVRFVKE